MSTITDTVLASGAPGTYDSDGTDFDLLRDAVIAAGLADTLADPDAELTVFAPIDAAFVSLAGALGFTGTDEGAALGHVLDALSLLGAGDPLTPLTDILTYHVLAGEVFEADVAALGDGASVGTLQGGSVTLEFDTTPISLIDADPGLADPGLIATDIDVSNGVIHALDGVLLPLSVTGLLSQPGTDLVIGTNGRDVVHGRKGDDLIDGNAGKDMLKGGAGDDVILGGRGGDMLEGRKGDDLLLGEAGKDQLRGGAGDDTIDGGAGRDLLAGGGGEDVFVFSTGYDRDVIVNFRDGVDRIDISGTGIEDFDALSHVLSGGGHRAKIDLGGGDELVLIGVGVGQLDAGDFIFA